MQHVLIVEDDSSVASMVAGVLRAEGFVVTIETDGKKALDTLQTRTFNAVLLDIMLPGMDGISLMRAIRDDPVTESLPVVILTAKTDDATTWAGWRAGCNYYVTKPFDPDELSKIVKSLQPAPAGPIARD